MDVYGQPEHGEHQHDDDEREAGLSLPVGLTTSLAHSDRRLVVAARQHRRHCRHRSRQRGTMTRYVTSDGTMTRQRGTVTRYVT